MANQVQRRLTIGQVFYGETLIVQGMKAIGSNVGSCADPSLQAEGRHPTEPGQHARTADPGVRTTDPCYSGRRGLRGHLQKIGGDLRN